MDETRWFADIGAPGLQSPNRDSDRKGSLPALLPWAIGGAWTIVILTWATGRGGALGHDHLIEHGPALWVALGLFLMGWQVMVVAMMLPSSLSAFQTFGALTFDRRDRRDRRGLGAAFLAGYIAVWTGFGSLAFLGDIGFHRFVDRSPWLAGRPWLIGGSVLLVAGVFELSPLPGRCGKRTDRMSARLGGDRRLVNSDAMRLGADHGLQRLRRCWPLMVLSFAVGMASLGWMVVLTLLMVVQEREGPRRVALLMGIGLLAAAAIVIAHPGWMPSLFPSAA